MQIIILILTSILLLSGCSLSKASQIKELEKRLTTFVLTSKYQHYIDASEKILELDPKHPDAYFIRGMCFQKDKKYIEAIECFDNAAKYHKLTKMYKNEKNPVLSKRRHESILMCSYYYKAQCLESLGQLEEAVENYNLAIKHGYDDRQIYFERMDTLRKLGRFVGEPVE